jgi:transcriptional regulator GlxA family with amidase domain
MKSDEPRRRTLGVLLFPGFELLDVFGPLEAFGIRVAREHFDTILVADQRGAVESAQGPKALAEGGIDDARPLDLVLVPGGIGTRKEVDNRRLTAWIDKRSVDAELVMSVCTGAALLARAGVLDGRRATSNKAAFDWVVSQGREVHWVKQARWVEDGKFWTSSGVSAGIDMALAVIARLTRRELAEEIAVLMEYEWHREADHDPFAAIHKLV